MRYLSHTPEDLRAMCRHKRRHIMVKKHVKGNVRWIGKLDAVRMPHVSAH